METLSPKPLSRFPDELKAIPRWVAWQLEDGKKIPKNPHTGGNAMVNVPTTWGSFEDAIGCGLNVGFVLTEDDPYTCVDLDKVITGNELDPRAREILDLIEGYVELSPSGTGLHIWVRASELVNRRTKGIEIYSSQRWMTVTGRASPQAPTVIPDRTEQLAELVRRYFTVEPSRFTTLRETTPDDDELWARLFRSKNRDFIEALYKGDLSVVGGDHSRGVVMLANLLAVFTEGDEARMKQLLLQTGLVNDKWFEKRGQGTWLDYQVRDAIMYVKRRRR